MKNKFLIALYVTLVSLPLLQYSGCSSNPITGTPGNPPMFGGYHQNDAAVMMTLAAL